MQSGKTCDKVKVEDGWITCPGCGRNHRLLRIDNQTEAQNLRIYCRTCRTEIVLNIERGQSVKKVKDGWITCPGCGRNHRLLRIDDRTEARNLRIYCRTCRTEIVLNIERGQSVKRQSPC